MAFSDCTPLLTGQHCPIIYLDCIHVKVRDGNVRLKAAYLAIGINMVSQKATDLKRIYTSATADEAEQRLSEFEDKWDDAYLPISHSWRRNWPRIIPIFDYPPEIRKVIYMTNAIESVNMSLRKIIKNRGSFPSDDALSKFFCLALRNISQKWTMPIRDWKAALTRFTIQFEDRMTQH